MTQEIKNVSMSNFHSALNRTVNLSPATLPSVSIHALSIPRCLHAVSITRAFSLPVKLSLRSHYKSCGKSHVKERLKRKALRRTQKTIMDGAEMTCRCRLFKVGLWTATRQPWSPTVDSTMVRRTFSDSEKTDRKHLWAWKYSRDMKRFFPGAF